MFYVSSIKDNLVGITDTYDNIEEFYSVYDIKEFPSHIKINGVSSKGIEKINLGEAILTRDIVKKIDCKKELTFEVVNLRDIFKYKLAGYRGITDDFIALETDNSIKLLSSRIIKLEGFNGSRGLFESTNFTKIDFHHTNTSNISNMRDMFRGCRAKYLDLSSFDTSNVENMMDMFWDCHAKYLDLSSFNTSNVKTMYCMFKGCHATSLNLSSFNTLNVESMYAMFFSCHATSLDLSNFDTSNVRNMDDIFRNYRGTIKSIDDKILRYYSVRRIV